MNRRPQPALDREPFVIVGGGVRRHVFEDGATAQSAAGVGDNDGGIRFALPHTEPADVALDVILVVESSRSPCRPR